MKYVTKTAKVNAMPVRGISFLFFPANVKYDSKKMSDCKCTGIYSIK